MIREINVERSGLQIYTRLYLPEGEGKAPYPVVILPHGFNGSCEHSIPYAQKMNDAGIAAVIFDFCGGTMHSHSDGVMIQMSVETEKQDLICVIDAISGESDLDMKNLFLMGRSQGGLVSAMVAAELPDAIRGLILLYPAFSIPRQAKDMFANPEDVPDEMEFLGAVIGRKYYDDVVKVDPITVQKAYSGNVLIMQGQQDDLVPPETAEDAVKTYAHAKIIRFADAGHGFEGNDFERAAFLAAGFIAKSRFS